MMKWKVSLKLEFYWVFHEYCFRLKWTLPNYIILFFFSFCRSLKCARITLHMNLFASFAANNFLWLIWYQVVIFNDALVLKGKDQVNVYDDHFILQVRWKKMWEHRFIIFIYSLELDLTLRNKVQLITKSGNKIWTTKAFRTYHLFPCPLTKSYFNLAWIYHHAFENRHVPCKCLKIWEPIKSSTLESPSCNHVSKIHKQHSQLLSRRVPALGTSQFIKRLIKNIPFVSWALDSNSQLRVPLVIITQKLCNYFN